MITRWPPGSTRAGARSRAAAASATWPGRYARVAISFAIRSANITALRQDVLHLSDRRHRLGAGQPRGHDAPRSDGELHDGRSIPPGQQPVAERAAKGVAGPEAVEHLHVDRGYLDGGRPVHGEHSLRSLLHDGEIHPETQ